MLDGGDTTSTDDSQLPEPKPQQQHHETWWQGRKHNAKVFAKYCPLISAIIAPLSTLLDIPALTQHWYDRNGVAQPDFTVSLVLSAIGLALNVVANVLLVIRFSSHSRRWWTKATRLSLVFWIGKTGFAIANLITFGVMTRNGEGYTYAEGFWCAVISLVLAGVISLTLTLHYFLAFGKKAMDTKELRNEGKRFIISFTAFIAILGIQSLAFARLEGWAYADAIYFSTQTALTIGFGDYSPTSTAGKVLVFIFSVLTISQLGNEIGNIISFFSSLAQQRRDSWRRKYEGAMHREANSLRPNASLLEEMALIAQINRREELVSQLYDLVWSAIALATFWLAGAGIFSSIEGWSYGNALYMVMILSLTIDKSVSNIRKLTISRFGDYTPKQPAGRVVFIVYALMAVPIVTSFVVQTITGLLSTYSGRGSMKEAFFKGKAQTPDAFAPHSEFIRKAHHAYAALTTTSTIRSDNTGNAANDDDAAPDDVDETEDAVPISGGGADSEVDNAVASEISQRDLVRHLVELTTKLEAVSRQLIVDNMEKGIARTLLMADRRVQTRDARATVEEKRAPSTAEVNIDHPSELDMVRSYRHLFAEVLVVGSKLQKLEGQQARRFERWRDDSPEGERLDEDLHEIGKEKFDGFTRLLVKQHIQALKRNYLDKPELQRKLASEMAYRSAPA